ncbi:MAG: hypothetical protein HQM10_02285 [Candidatus Riflebacteria bacterium]|nr:hypothetical protein [Candidatus Riflebacteria bacterium]
MINRNHTSVWIPFIARFITNNQTSLFLFVACLTSIMGWLAWQNTFDYDLRSLLGGETSAFLENERCIELFGPDDDIYIASEIEGLGSAAFSKALTIREAIADIAGISHVFDAASIMGITSRQKLDWLNERPKVFKRQLSEFRLNKSAHGFLVGKHEKSQVTVVRTEALSNLEKHELVRAIRKNLKERIPDIPCFMSGFPVFSERHLYHSIRGNRQFLLISPIFAFFISWLMFRSISLSIAILISIFLPVIWTHGLYAALGFRISLYSSLLSPIILFVGLSLAVQFIARYKIVFYSISSGEIITRKTQSTILEQTLADALVPGFFCSLTTILGFLSQVFSTIPGVRAFGIFSSCGCACSFISVFFLLPGLFQLFPSIHSAKKRTNSSSDFINDSGFDFGHFAGRFLARLSFPPGAVIIFILSISLLLSLGMTRLTYGSDPMEELPENDLAMEGFRFFRKNFDIGERQISLIAKSSGTPFESAEGMALLKRMEKTLASDPAVLSVIGPGHILAEVYSGFLGGSSETRMTNGDVNRAIRFAESRAESWIGSFLNIPFHDRARFIVGIRYADSPRVIETATRLEKLVESNSSGDMIATATGRMLLSSIIEKEAMDMEIGSFMSSLFGILCVIAIGFRNFRLFFVAAIPNVLPILCILGFMGWLNKSLDLVTAMIPCICMGIIVDDTIHLIYETQKFEEKGYGWRRNRVAVMLRIGWASLSTSLILVAGLGILCLSDFKPIRDLGIYSALTIGFAPIFDLFFTPALLAITASKAMSEKKPPEK